MIYTEMTKKALELSFEAHKNQQDKGGAPYVYHPFHLAEQMVTEETVTVALLHDVVEDTDYTLDDLRAKGFPERVIEALALLAHEKTTPYADYVAAIKSNPIAWRVKLADLLHNSDLLRLDKINDKDKARAEKYRQSIAILRDGYPEFKYLVETMDEEGKEAWTDSEKMRRNVEKRERGEEYSLSDHVGAMVFAELSNQRKWGPIEENADLIRNSIFFNFDVERILKVATEQPQSIVDALTKKKLGNRQIAKQIETLPENIHTLHRIAEEHGSVDKYYNHTPTKDVIRELSVGKYKLKQMGVPLVSEYLRNVGVDLVKPDVHVMRLLYRLGYTEHPAKFDEAFNVCDKIAETYKMRRFEVDSILWGYCAEDRLKRCTENNPGCLKCKAYPCARCPNNTAKQG